MDEGTLPLHLLGLYPTKGYYYMYLDPILLSNLTDIGALGGKEFHLVFYLR